MYLVKVERISEGMHPSEVEAEIITADGSREYVFVDRRSMECAGIKIGHPIADREGAVLVELPRETHKGAWRLWVPSGSLMPSLEAY